MISYKTKSSVIIFIFFSLKITELKVAVTFTLNMINYKTGFRKILFCKFSSKKQYKNIFFIKKQYTKIFSKN